MCNEGCDELKNIATKYTKVPIKAIASKPIISISNVIDDTSLYFGSVCPKISVLIIVATMPPITDELKNKPAFFKATLTTRLSLNY